MKLKSIIISIIIAIPAFAQQQTDYFLHSVREVSNWDCVFYELNRNSDIELADKADWASLNEDESDWQVGVGPFSTDENIFFITDWASEVHPLLVRRHFTLTAEDLEHIYAGEVYLEYSYDENPRVWLNGTLIASASGWNDNNYTRMKLAAKRKTLFVEGDNVLSVSVQQGAGGGHIDYCMYAKYSTDGITEITPNAKQTRTLFNINGQKISSKNIIPNSIVIDNNKTIIKDKQ